MENDINEMEFVLAYQEKISQEVKNIKDLDMLESLYKFLKTAVTENAATA